MQLDDENETLDWGNEEEDCQDSPRKPHSGPNPQDSLLGDDVEDTISLGDDEDDQRFYSISRHGVLAPSASYNPDRPASPPSSHTKSTLSGANGPQPGQHTPELQSRPATASVRETAMSQDAPQKQSSAHQSSPRSLPRLTHALPPKPVAASVTALSQSFIIAATTMTVSPRPAGRDSKKTNGNPAKSGSPASADLPQDWETRSSRKGETYYYNRVTHECTWTHPDSKPSVGPPSAQEEPKSRRQGRSVSPAGNKQTMPSEPNTSLPQTSRSGRDFSRNGEPVVEHRRRPLPTDANGLTFEDRHYRPGFDSVSISDGVRGLDRPDVSTSAGRYARSPSPRRRRSPSPPGSKESDLHFITKEPRDQRSVQEKPTQSRTDSYVPDYDTRHWPPPPAPQSPTDYRSRNQVDRVSYASEDRMQVDDYRAGPSSIEDVIRDHRQRSKDGDPPPARSSDVRELSASQNYYSAQRSRSPAPLPPTRDRDHDMRDGRRERDYYHEGSGVSTYNPGSVSALRSDRGQRDGQRSERGRSRQHERSPGPRSGQDYTRREWQIDIDEDYSRGRNLEPERIREGGPLERGRELHSARRELIAEIDVDGSSTQRPPVSELRGSQDDSQSKRNPKVFESKPEEPSSARPKRAPLPPQQASFRSARLRDPPPHPISTPSRKQGDNPRPVLGVNDDPLPRQPRNSSNAVQLPSSESSHPNSLDPERFERLSYARDISDKRTDVTREYPGRRQLGPSDRGLPDDPQRSSNVILDSGRRDRSPGTRTSTNENARRDSDSDKTKEKTINRERGSRDVQPELERSSSRRSRDPPKQTARLTGTNNIPIGNRRGIQTTQRPDNMPLPVGSAVPPDLEVGPLSATRNLPPGKESYERPHGLAVSDVPRRPVPSIRTETDKGRAPQESRQPPTRQDGESRGQRPHSRFLAVDQYPNGSSYRPSSPPPVSRDFSGSKLSNITERLPSIYPALDGRPDVGYYANQNTDRGPYRERDESTRRDPHRELRRPSYSPKHFPANEGDTGHPPHLSYGVDTLPPRPRDSLPGADRDIAARRGEPKRSPVDRSDFISRVEPPPLQRGGSLLDRLSIDTKGRGLTTDSIPSASLRDRLVPSKRGRDDMMASEGSTGRGVHGERSQDLEGSESKRAKKRGGGKRRSGRRS